MKRDYFGHLILLAFSCVLLFSASLLKVQAEDSSPTNFSFEEEYSFDKDSTGAEVRYECELLTDTKYAEAWLFGADLEYYYDVTMVSESGEIICYWENMQIKAGRYTGQYFREPLEAGRYTFIIKCNEVDTSSTALGRVKILFYGTYAIRPTEITISDESLYIMQGRTHQLSTTYAPDYANTDTKTVWTSSNKAVATVNSNGLVTAVGAGEAIITAKVGELQKTCTFKVEKSQGLFFETKEMGEYLWEGESANTNFTLPVKGGIALYFWGEGEGRFYLKQNGKVLWQSKDFSIYDDEVLCTVPLVLEPGKYTITTECKFYAFHQEGYILYDTVDYYKATSIKLNKKTKTVAIGKQFYLRGSVTPAYTSSAVKWSSSNKKVASVDQFGLVTAKKMGKTVITVSVDGKKAKCTVYVTKQKLESWTGKTKDLSKKVTNVPGYKKGKWTSSNPSVASVDSKGRVTFRTHGKAKITLTAKGKKYVFTVYAYSKSKLKQMVIDQVKGDADEDSWPPTFSVKKVTYDNKNFACIITYWKFPSWSQGDNVAAGYYYYGKFHMADLE